MPLDLTERCQRNYTRTEWAVILIALSELDDAVLPLHLRHVANGLAHDLQNHDICPVGVLTRALHQSPA